MSAAGPEPSPMNGGAAGPTPAKRRRRKFDRQFMTAAVTVTEVDHQGSIGTSWACRTSDISRGGLGIRSRRMVHVGRGLLVELEATAGAEAKVLYGIVRQACYIPGQGYSIGLQFQAPPGCSPVRRWLAARERRKQAATAGPGPAK